MRTDLRLVLLSTAAWILLAVLWSSMAIFDFDASWELALRTTVRTVPSAWLLSFGVWWICSRTRWNGFLDVSFLLVHLVAAVGFALAWVALRFTIGYYQVGWDLERFWSDGEFVAWRVLYSVSVYMVIAGISYSVQLGREVADREREIAESRALLSETKMEALAARLNPHFLFNALHCVGSIVQDSPTMAQAALARLGDMLRYVLRAHREPDGKVILARELEFVGNYLELEQIRLGDRLRFEERVQNTVLSAKVPPLLIQPLVENAVQHGVASNPKGGRVEVDIRQEASSLYVVIRNTYDPTYPHRGTGLGLDTLRERIRILYSQEASLETSRSADRNGKWFETTVRLPSRS